jgi:hypothetical protein
MRMGVRSSAVAVAVLLGALTLAPAAHAEILLEERGAVDRAVDRTCFDGTLAAGTGGVALHDLTATEGGMLDVSLDARGGDWDVAVFGDEGRLVTAAASSAPDELATGFVFPGEELVAQVCHRGGAESGYGVSAELTPATGKTAETSSLVRVETPNADSVARLQELGLDLTEHGRPGFVDVVLHGLGDGQALTAAGFEYETLVPDLLAQSRRQMVADQRRARQADAATMPSGRTTYRRLFDYSEDLKQLAADYPDLVRPITLAEETYEGRPVEGIEITRDVGSRKSDAKPGFLMMGVHHAREWPSGEHSIEWAYELLEGHAAGKRRAKRLVRDTRTFVVPIVNPDGFNASREAGELAGAGGGRGGPDETANIVSSPNEYRRKNCRLPDDSEAGDCSDLMLTSVGLAEGGVDPNRNYGGFWGGPGAATDPTDQTYRGPGPFSEPETRNVRKLLSRNQVTGLITNHTYSNLVLRPPGIQAQGEPFDEEIYKALGDSMAAQNGYTSQRSYQLYDTTGGTEDWSYYATGGLGFTFEIGPINFHPPFAETVAEWKGATATADSASDGGGNRAAYYLAAESAADPAAHSLIAGRAPPEAVLRLRKEFDTPTFENQHGTVSDQLRTRLRLEDRGKFEWHVNPSTRPLVAKGSGRDPTGSPSPPESFSGTPGPSATPCADAATEDETCFNDHPFTVPSGAGIDNAKATIAITWSTPSSDWDMYVYRDADGDGSSAGETEPIAASAQGTTNSEQTTIEEPVLVPGASYVVRVVNYAAGEPYDGSISYGGPDPLVPPMTEDWTLICKLGGKVRARADVYVERGDRVRVDMRDDCTK